MRTITLLTVLLLIGSLSGCGKREEPLYEGLPLRIWGERLSSSEPEIRKDALEVIATVGVDALSLEPEVRQIARQDPYADIRLKAVDALDAMGTSIDEFRDLIDKYTSPIIPESEEEAPESGIGEEEEPFEKVSEGDDLEYLKALEEGTVDTEERPSETLPTDSAELAKWVEEHRNVAVQDLLDQLRDPRVLANLLLAGELLERRFAAGVLAQMEGGDSTVIAALEEAKWDADSLVSALSSRALKRWTQP